MPTTCPKCGYARKSTDAQPAWQCPNCGIAYVKAGETSSKTPPVIHAASTEASHGGVLKLVLAVAVASGAYAWYRHGQPSHPAVASGPASATTRPLPDSSPDSASTRPPSESSTAPAGSVELTTAEVNSQFPGIADKMGGSGSPAVKVHWYKTELPDGRVSIATRRLMTDEARGELRAITNAQIVLFGTADCPYCAQVRSFFRARKIAYADLDIENNARARDYEIETLKTRAYPVIVVYNEVHYGWNESELARSVQRN